MLDRRAWENEKEKPIFGKQPSFRMAIARAFGWDYIKCSPLVFIEVNRQSCTRVEKLEQSILE